jgi:hypothetical protein
MLGHMASQWRTLQQILRGTEHFVFSEAPKLLRQLQNPDALQRTLQQGLRMGLEALVATALPAEGPKAIATGRPVTQSSVPTAHRARQVIYAPDLDGRADPGEVVWTWVVYEDDPTRGKDRPVLVVGRERRVLLGLMLSMLVLMAAFAAFAWVQSSHRQLQTQVEVQQRLRTAMQLLRLRVQRAGAPGLAVDGTGKFKYDSLSKPLLGTTNSVSLVH